MAGTKINEAALRESLKGTENIPIVDTDLPKGRTTLANLKEYVKPEPITVDSELSATSENPVQNKALKSIFDEVDGQIAGQTLKLDGKVDKEAGKGLSSNDFTAAQKGKLAGIEDGAQKNVQPDWNATEGDSFIKNKPTIPKAVTVDAELSDTSENPVQNKAIAGKVNEMQGYLDLLLEAGLGLWYGVEWDVTESDSALTRIGNMDLHRSLPLQNGMYRCVLDDDGGEAYRLGAEDSTKKEDGVTAAALDGTDGMVMVRIPVFYAKFVRDGNKRRVLLSANDLPGFARMGGCYISAYEAAIDRSTSGTPKLASVTNGTANYRGGNNNAEWDGTYRSLLGVPATSVSLTNFRAYARNRKSGSTEWNCMDYQAYKALYWLYVVEYADRNCQLGFNDALTDGGFRQGGLGPGVTNLDGKWQSFNNYLPFVPCGTTNGLGNKTGNAGFAMPFEYDAGGEANYKGEYSDATAYGKDEYVSQGESLYKCVADAEAGTALTDTAFFAKATRTAVQVPSYRGIENPFGHVWKWTDGLLVKVQSGEAGGHSILYTAADTANYRDSSYDGYDETGDIARANGYVKDILFDGGEMLPTVTTGSSSTKDFSDYYYTDIPESGEGRRGVLFGGGADGGSKAGFASAYTICAPSTAIANIGSRLCFIPGTARGAAK